MLVLRGVQVQVGCSSLYILIFSELVTYYGFFLGRFKDIIRN